MEPSKEIIREKGQLALLHKKLSDEIVAFLEQTASFDEKRFAGRFQTFSTAWSYSRIGFEFRPVFPSYIRLKKLLALSKSQARVTPDYEFELNQERAETVNQLQKLETRAWKSWKSDKEFIEPFKKLIAEDAAYEAILQSKRDSMPPPSRDDEADWRGED